MKATLTITAMLTLNHIIGVYEAAICKKRYTTGIKMLQIIQNMMFSQGLELELSMFKRTTISGQHLLI